MRIVMFASAKTKIILLLVLFILVLCLGTALFIPRAQPAAGVTSVQMLPLAGKVFVLDPGHGGYDPGVMQDNVLEKQIVLEIALKLRHYLQSAGARVVMTRETDRDFLTVAGGPKKQQDMKNRMQIANEAKPDLFLSIHINSINSAVWHGAQTFYKSNCEQSKGAAEKIQKQLIRVLANTDRAVKAGDFYVLNNMESAAVLVECGFLSNPQEAELLADPAYQSKIAWSVYLGLVSFYSPAF
jgi:N-acetylmuramoyl-L-alanine amidase